MSISWSTRSIDIAHWISCHISERFAHTIQPSSFWACFHWPWESCRTIRLTILSYLFFVSSFGLAVIVRGLKLRREDVGLELVLKVNATGLLREIFHDQRREQEHA
jgi:hypothetical protein